MKSGQLTLKMGLFRSIIGSSVKEQNQQDKLHQWLLRLTALSVLGVLVLMIWQLYIASKPAINEFGLGFITSSAWDPIDENYGALAFIFGTCISSLIAVGIATPLCLGTAFFIVEICPPSLRRIFSFIVESLAAIPSIVYGLWALFFLGPLVRDLVFPFTQKYLGFLPFIDGPSYGPSLLTASLVLAIMITPIITSVSVEVFKKMPALYKEGALALGATRSEMMWIAMLKPGLGGILGAVVLGLGRAFGETMAVAMVIGNKPEIVDSLFQPAATMASIIANEYAEATDDIHLGALSYIGLVLFVVSLFINLISRYFVFRYTYSGSKK